MNIGDAGDDLRTSGDVDDTTHGSVTRGGVDDDGGKGGKRRLRAYMTRLKHVGGICCWFPVFS